MTSKKKNSTSTIKYQIPLLGVKFSTNKIYAGTHWMVRREIKDRIFDMAESYCQPVQKIKSYPVEICYKFSFGTKPLDSSNCSAMVKMFEDAMCRIGIIKDDDPRYVSKTSITIIVLPKAKDKDLLEILITPIC